MADENETGSNLIWAIATIIIVCNNSRSTLLQWFFIGEQEAEYRCGDQTCCVNHALAAFVKKSAPEYSGALNIKPFLEDRVF